ncbi:hypothetical protein HY993_03005 [Candidatus Micrarchaeota archaeon]|nr:hypothetical protein [Candidatus Micrarchaeota archaeon]
MKINTWFVTNDAFRRGNRADKNLTFEKMAEKALQTTYKLFGIKLRILRLEPFIREFRFMPKIV